MKLSILCATLTIVVSVVARSIIVHNLCPYTVWPGVATRTGEGPRSGFETKSMSARELIVPDNWTGGEIWGRRDCDFNKPKGKDDKDCAIGTCRGGLECKGSSEDHPVTRAMISLGQRVGDPKQGLDPEDIYYVSLVAGFGVPVRIAPSAEGCRIAECAADLAANCPGPLRGPTDSNGVPLGCKSACFAQLQGDDPMDSPNCCTGRYERPDECPSSGVQFYELFKNECPTSQVYTFDKSFLWTCAQKHNSDYTVTFCPRK